MLRDRTNLGRVRYEADMAVRRAARKGGPQDAPSAYVSTAGVVSGGGSGSDSVGESLGVEVSFDPYYATGLSLGVNYLVTLEFSAHAEFEDLHYDAQLHTDQAGVVISQECNAKTTTKAAWTLYISPDAVAGDYGGATDLQLDPLLFGPLASGGAGPYAGTWSITEIPAAEAEVVAGFRLEKTGFVLVQFSNTIEWEAEFGDTTVLYDYGDVLPARPFTTIPMPVSVAGRWLFSAEVWLDDAPSDTEIGIWVCRGALGYGGDIWGQRFKVDGDAFVQASYLGEVAEGEQFWLRIDNGSAGGLTTFRITFAGQELK